MRLKQIKTIPSHDRFVFPTYVKATYPPSPAGDHSHGLGGAIKLEKFGEYNGDDVCIDVCILIYIIYIAKGQYNCLVASKFLV